MCMDTLVHVLCWLDPSCMSFYLDSASVRLKNSRCRPLRARCPTHTTLTMAARLPGSQGRKWASAPPSMSAILGRAERENRRSDGPRIDIGPPPERIPAQAVGGGSQVVGRGAPAGITASTLLLGTDSCVWTARGLGPSVPGSSAKLSLRIGVLRRPWSG